MGFSVSGAMAVILIGVFVAIAMAFPAAMTGLESISDAHGYQQSQLEALHNAEITLDDANHDAGNQTLTVNLTNSGSEALSVQATHLLVDGAFEGSLERSIEANDNASVWLPGEVLTLETDAADEPNRVKVVTEFGLTVTTEEVQSNG